MQPINQNLDLPTLDRVIDLSFLTVASDKLALDAISLLSQTQSSCVLVVEKSQLLGIFTERDVVRLVASKSDLSTLKLASVMTRDVVTLTPSTAKDTSLALSLMNQHQIHHLPIVNENGQVIGLVTQSSLLQKLIQLPRPDLAPEKSGQYAGALAMVTDTSLTESEARFRTMADTALILIWVAGIDKLCDYFNKPWLEFTGRTLEQEIGNGWATGIHPDDFQRCLNTYFAAFDDRQPFTMEYRLRRFDGEYRWLLDTGNPRYNGDGSFAGYIGSCIDISDRKLVEDKLRTGEEQLRLALDFSHTGSWDWDLLANKISWNENFDRLLGLVPGEFVASYETWRDRVHPEDIARVEEALKYALATHTYYATEYRIIHPDGSLHHLAGRGQALYNEAGEAVRMVGVIFDISKVKRVEAELQESRQNYVTLTQAVPVGIFRTDAEGHCLYVNDRWCQITGLSLQATRRDGWAQALHPEDRERVFSQWYQCTQQNLPFESEYRFQRADGVITWVFGQAIAERGIDERLIGYVGTITDISEVKQAEEALRQYERIVSATADGIALVNRDYTFRLINQTYLLLHEKSYNEIIGHTLGELLGEDVFTNPIKPLLDRSLTGETIRYEAWFNYARAGRRFIGVTYAPYFEIDGTISGVVIHTRDLSQLKQAEQKIVEQAMLLDVATDAIFVRDLDSKILFWNNGAASIYGWSSAEVLGKKASDILYPQITPQHQEALKTVVESGWWQGELSKVDSEGKAIVVASRWTLVRDDQGKPKSILTVDTDITEKKALAAQFLRAQRMESIGTLAGGIAHDLNNVLAPILMSVQILQVKYPEDRERRLLDLLENNVKRGAALVKQVLSFARGFEGDRTIVQVRHLILEIANIVKETFPKSIEFYSDIASDLGTISADATQLHQVLMNLVVNARDAMPNGGTLRIDATNLAIDDCYARMHIEAKVGSYIVITVADTGIGIPPEIIDRIFDPFFTTKEVGKGTGLGLSTTIGIIKNHDGFVEVCSQVGKGSQFKVYLPATLVTVNQLAQSSELLTGQGELILVVDDETPICEMTKTALESYNYKVLTANNGIKAIPIYAHNKQEISLVLIDMMMPEMDGITTIRTLQKINPHISIVAMSGLTSMEDCAQATANGARGFLSKPFTAQELLTTISEIIANKKSPDSSLSFP